MSILNNLKQGLVLSGGVGSRNGGTVENPFPKTLQILGGRTVLERILYGQYLLGVKDVAITVPARQLNIYIPELKKIQEKWHQEVAVVPVEVKRGGGIESALAEACELMLDGYMFRVNDGKRVCVLSPDCLQALETHLLLPDYQKTAKYFHLPLFQHILKSNGRKYLIY